MNSGLSMPSFLSTRSILIARPPSEVWEFIVVPANEALWHDEVVRAEAMSEGPLAEGSVIGWTMDFGGGAHPVTLRVARLVPGRLQELRAEHPVMSVQPTLVYEVAAEGRRTRFTRMIDMNPIDPTGPMADALRRRGDANNERYLGQLKRVLENAR